MSPDYKPRCVKCHNCQIYRLTLLSGGEKSKSKPVVRSISSGDSRTGVLPKLKRQSSSDGSGKLAEDYDDPIMV